MMIHLFLYNVQMRVSAEKCEVRVPSMVTTQILVVFFKDCHHILLYGDILDVHVLKVRMTICKTGLMGGFVHICVFEV